MPGPLPSPNPRRRNAPTISGSELPLEGRDGPVPEVPDSYELRSAGRAWWDWAWSLPQAAKWDVGSLYWVARRASLEDDLVTLEHGEDLDLAGLLGVDPDDDAFVPSLNQVSETINYVVGRLKAQAAGRNPVMREMRELDNRLGLNPKAMADLRWQISEGEKPPKARTPASARKLRAV